MAPPAAPSFDALGPWDSNSKIALACSGGADSTFLALKWRDFAKSLGDNAPKSVVWTVNHGHREGSAADAEQARAQYADLGFEVRVLTPPKDASNPKGEVGLRQLRYGLFAQAAAVENVTIILTAHHADDQAETLLLRILRGTGVRGLAGIPERRWLADFGMPQVEVRRPLLACRKAHIREFLTDEGQDWIEDLSNLDSNAAARNHLRNEILPRLEEASSIDPVKSLLKLAEDAQGWRKWIEDGFREEGQGWNVQWEDLPGVLRREGIAELLRRNGLVISRQRVSDLELALLSKRSANVDESQRISISAGNLKLLPRKDPQVRK